MTRFDFEAHQAVTAMFDAVSAGEGVFMWRRNRWMVGLPVSDAIVDNRITVRRKSNSPREVTVTRVWGTYKLTGWGPGAPSLRYALVDFVPLDKPS